MLSEPDLELLADALNDWLHASAPGREDTREHAEALWARLERLSGRADWRAGRSWRAGYERRAGVLGAL